MIIKKIFGKKKNLDVKIEVENLELREKKKEAVKETPFAKVSESTEWTVEKVKKFQEDHGLVADGVIGLRTMEAIKRSPVEEYAKYSDHGTIMIDSHEFLKRDFLKPVGVSGSTGYTIYVYTGENPDVDLKSISDSGYDWNELYSVQDIGNYGTSGLPGYSGSMGTSGLPGTSIKIKA